MKRVTSSCALHGRRTAHRSRALAGTVAIWVLLEVRQGVNHRRGGVKAGRGSEIIFRLAADAAWIGLGLLWCGIALRFWGLSDAGPVLHLHRPDER